MVDTTAAVVGMDAHAPRKRHRGSFDHTNVPSFQDDDHDAPNNTTSSNDSTKRIRSSQGALMVPFDEINDGANIDGTIGSYCSSNSNSAGVLVAMKDDQLSTSLSSNIHSQHSPAILNILHAPPPRDDAANLERSPLLLPPQPSHHRVSVSPPPPPRQVESRFQVRLPPLSSSATPTTTHSDVGHGGTTTSVTRTSTVGTTPDHGESQQRRRRHFSLLSLSWLIPSLLLIRILFYWRIPSWVNTFPRQHPMIVRSSFPTPPPSSQSFSGSWFQWFRPTLGYQSSKPTTAATTTTLLSNRNVTTTQPLTLRQVLQDDIGFHLAMAPAFFGFYGYFGMLSAWYDVRSLDDDDDTPLRSVAGASAGAMAAILIAAGIHPRDAMNFCANITVNQYADFPGLLALFRGNLFEQLLHDFLISAPLPNNNGTSSRSPILFLQDARIPVAVTAFDIQTMTTQILVEGPMARAARASATFPGLFQPVGYRNYNRHDAATTTTKGNTKLPKDFLLMDGGIWDMAGTMGLTHTMAQPTKQQQQQQQRPPPRQRVINLCVGSFRSLPGPDDFSPHHHPEVISISMMGLPQPGPWAMSNGPLAYDRARDAMRDALDSPLVRVDLDVTQHAKRPAISPHYQLVINV